MKWGDMKLELDDKLQKKIHRKDSKWSPFLPGTLWSRHFPYILNAYTSKTLIVGISLIYHICLSDLIVFLSCRISMYCRWLDIITFWQLSVYKAHLVKFHCECQRRKSFDPSTRERARARIFVRLQRVVIRARTKAFFQLFVSGMFIK